jgi:mono/diheme cytochrome c family protein
MEPDRLNATRRLMNGARCFAAIMLAAGTAALSACGGGASSNPAATQVAGADVPAEHADGKRLYDTYCARCHGVHAGGTGRGPSFLSNIYEPSHHGDQAFALAVKRGVTAHHWGFGNMPPVPGVADDDIAKIVGYVRWAQRVVGIS